MKKIYLIFFVVLLCPFLTMKSQNLCQNGGFEQPLNATQDGLRGYFGQNLNPSFQNFCNADIIHNGNTQVNIPLLTNNTAFNPIVIVQNGTTDPNIPINIVDSGNRSIRINQFEQNPIQDNDEATLIKNFTATADITSISFRFAYVISNLGGNGSHPDPDNDAYFRAGIYEGNTPNEITTQDSRFCLRANVNDCIFNPGNPNTNVSYTNWATVTLDFDPTPFLGQIIQLRIEVADCSVDSDPSYAYVDNICTTIPETPRGNIQFNDENTYDCTDLPIEICGTYNSPYNLDNTPNQLGNIALEIIQNNQVDNILSNAVIFPTTPDSGSFCFTVNETDLGNLNAPYSFRVVATFTNNDNCPNIMLTDDGPVLNVSSFCCFDNSDLEITTSCGILNCSFCDTPNDSFLFRVRDPQGQVINNISYPDVSFEWQNQTTGASGTDDSFMAMVGDEVTVIVTLDNCDISVCATLTCNGITTCEIPPLCEGCQEVANNIIAIDTGWSCGGQYFVPFGTNECYSVYLTYLNDDPIPFLQEIFDGWNYYAYYAYDIIVVDNSTGQVCAELTDFPTPTGCLTDGNQNNKKTKILYPNPFNESIFINNDLKDNIQKVEIYNVFGKLITTQDYRYENSIKITKGTAGLYFAKVYFIDGSIETIQLLKN